MSDRRVRKRQGILFIAHQACENSALCAEVRAHAEPGADVLVVAPVLGFPSHQWISDDADDRALAEERLEKSISCLCKHGLRAHGMLGDADPVQAIADALYRFAAEEIVICLEGTEKAHWLHRGVVERTKRLFALPVTEITVAPRQAVAVS
jgi:LmbE family N-acetylglucosaminyl deacetylase